MDDLQADFDCLSLVFAVLTPSIAPEQQAVNPHPQFVHPTKEPPDTVFRVAKSDPNPGPAVKLSNPLAAITGLSPPPQHPSVCAYSLPSATDTMDVQSSTLPQQAPDLVAVAISEWVKEERRRNFAFMGRQSHRSVDSVDFAVHRAETGDIDHAIWRWNLSAQDIKGDVQWYNFKQLLTKLVDTVPLRLCPSSSLQTTLRSTLPRLEAARQAFCSSNITQIEALDVEEMTWMDVRDWLKKKLEWHDAWEWKYPEQQREEMKLWWSGNGKYFDLLGLPTELRGLIYLAAAGTILVPEVKVNRWGQIAVTMGKGLRNRIDDINSDDQSQTLPATRKRRPGAALDPDIERPNLNLLHVSRQVHSEFKASIWTSAYKRFRATDPENICQHPFLNFTNLALPSALVRLQLEMSAACYFSLIGIRPKPGLPLDRAPNFRNDDLRLSILHSLPSLKYLDLRFISSKHAEAVCPWSGSNFPPQEPEQPIKHSCQKKWIDMFFILAFEDLTKIRHVTLSGCIKNSTREKWEPRLRVMAAQKGGFQEMMVERTVRGLKKELVKEDSEPLECDCAVPCWKGENYFRELESLEDLMEIEGLGAAIDEQYFSFDD